MRKTPQAPILIAVTLSAVAAGTGGYFLTKRHGISFSQLERKVASAPSSEKDALSDFLALSGGEIPSPENLLEFIKTRALNPPPPLQIGQETFGLFGFGATLIPKGRSPEAPHTDFNAPRSLLAFPVKPEGRFIYMGYSSRQDLLQIISEDQGPSPRMRFSEVRGYGRPGATLVRDVEQQCISCHMYGRLVFPTNDWRETLQNQRIFRAERAVRSTLDGLAKSILDEETMRRQRHPDSPQNASSNGFVFQIATDLGQRRVQTYHYCSHICRGDLRCVRDLILSQIEYRLVGFDGERNRTLNERLKSRLQKLYKETPISQDFGSIDWRDPEEPILSLAVASRTIADRDPLDANGNLIEYREGDMSTAVIEGRPGSTLLDLSPRLDPRAQAPMLLLLDPGQSSFDCVPLTREQKTTLSRRSPAEREQRAMSTELRRLLNSWPSSGRDIAAFMAADTAVHSLPDRSSQWDRGATISDVESDRSSPLDTLRVACARCHQSQNRNGTLYLPLESLAQMRTFRGPRSGRSPLDFLQNRLMPPPGSDAPLSNDDRAEVIRALSGE